MTAPTGTPYVFIPSHRCAECSGDGRIAWLAALVRWWVVTPADGDMHSAQYFCSWGCLAGYAETMPMVAGVLRILPQAAE